MFFTGSILFSLVSGFYLAQDPYFQMNSANLNTMNSYITPIEVNIDPTDYQDHQYRLQKDDQWYRNLVNNFDKRFDGWLEQGIRLHWMSSYNGMIIMFLWFFVIAYRVRYRKKSAFSLLFISIFEWIRDLFEDLLGKEKPMWMKQYVVYTFFIILLSNLMGTVNDIIRFAVPRWLRNVTNPTGEFEFAIALALIATIIPLVLQIKKLWPIHFVHEYVPITGKWLIEWKWFWPKLWDIIISLFTWFLDIVGIFSKVVSLSMRLFGNMSSGSILLNVMFLWIGWLTAWLTAMNLVVWIPIIVYIQWLLAAVVQAFVFAMLTSIGIKLAVE